MPEPEDYDHLNVPDLQDLAKEAGLEGYSTLNRGPLLELLIENDVPAPVPEDEDADLEPIDEDEIETDEVLEDPEDEQADDEGESTEEPEDDPDEEGDDLQRVRIHAGHDATYEYLDEHLDHEVQDYKRYKVEIPKSDVEELLDEAGQPFVTPLA